MNGGEKIPSETSRPILRIAAGSRTHDRRRAVGLASITAGRNAPLLLGLLALIAVGQALIHGWQNRYDVWSDGLSYLDMADAFSKGDWRTAVNGTWSPLYPFLVGSMMAVFRPSRAMEGPAVQVLNLVILALAVAAFIFLVRELSRLDEGSPVLELSGTPTSPWGNGLALISAVILTQTALNEFIRNDYVSPDLTVAAAFFLATALLVRIQRDAASIGTFAALGVTLGLGYLAKSVFSPLTILFLIAALGAGRFRARTAIGVGISLGLFVMIAAPWVVLLSHAKGRFTMGDAGRLNYAWYVGGVPTTPLAPARLLESEPEIFELDRPIPVTFPSWYDPSVWYEGIHARFDARRQASVIVKNARWYAHAIAGISATGVPQMEPTIVWGLALLLLAGGRGRRIWGDAWRHGWILLPALGGLGMYGLIQLQGRYVGSMIAVLFTVAFALVRMRAGGEARRLVKAVVAIILVSWFGRYAYGLSQWSRGAINDRRPLEVARALREVGVHPGERIAFVGESPRFYWARLAGVRIVSDLRDERLVEDTPRTDSIPRYWLGDEASRRRILQAFEKAGARFVVTDVRPPGEGWRPLGKSGLFALPLPVE
jgi:hypothetical protein